MIATLTPEKTREREAFRREIVRRGSAWQLRMAYFDFFGYDSRLPDFMNLVPEAKLKRYVAEQLTLYFTKGQLKRRLRWL